MAQPHLSRPAGAPAPARRRAQLLVGAALVGLVVTLGGCADGDRDQSRIDSQRDTMSHGGTEGND